jgi:signal transduction histidine kinase
MPPTGRNQDALTKQPTKRTDETDLKQRQDRHWDSFPERSGTFPRLISSTVQTSAKNKPGSTSLFDDDEAHTSGRSAHDAPRPARFPAMTEPFPNIRIRYEAALSDYLARPDEAALQQAYELGRAAMNAGCGIVDVTRMHHQALGNGAKSGDSPAIFLTTPVVEAFLLEVLAPFEAAYRCFGTARKRLQQINGVLAERNEELALSNSRLEEEIRVRRRAEEALRENKDHYYQLFQQAHAMERDLRELSAKVLSAQEDERKRISRELHDEVGQALTAVDVAIAMLKKQVRTDKAFERTFAEAEQLLAQSMETVHSFARELRPETLDHFGLHSALRTHVAAFTQRTGIKTNLVAHPKMDRISGPQGDVLFRVAQEALNNVYKHSEATAVEVAFSCDGDFLGMDITDNGCSFCVEEKLGSRPTGRLGLLGMRERVRLVDGSFAIESRPGLGTRIRVQVCLGTRARNLEPAGAPCNVYEMASSVPA